MSDYFLKLYTFLLLSVFFTLNFVPIRKDSNHIDFSEKSIDIYIEKQQYDEKQYKHIPALMIDENDINILQFNSSVIHVEEFDVDIDISFDFEEMNLSEQELWIKAEIKDWLKDHNKEIIMLAKTLWAEACGVKQYSHKAAVVWCVLNRVDDSGFGTTIKEVLTAPYQFAYRSKGKYNEDCFNIVKDVLIRWRLEKYNIENVGRVLPKDYLFFDATGYAGIDNRFRKDYYDKTYWDWSIKSPISE